MIARDVAASIEANALRAALAEAELRPAGRELRAIAEFVVPFARSGEGRRPLFRFKPDRVRVLDARL